ncbi:MAG: hypothetical protein J6O51_07985 [Bacteroidales bacterium]|nr:hypothetical protein [Bacteroidales bacterium]
MRTKDIYGRIASLEGGSVIFASDFLDLCTERQAGRVLTELEAKGEIKRLARGIYCKPIVTRFGPLYPDVSKIVEAVVQRDHAQVLPSGYTAANMLGLSTQVPMAYMFITSGSSRQLTVDGKTINLQRAVPRNFAYKTRLAALIVQALKATGAENIGPEEISALKNAIDKHPDKDAFRSDVLLMPVWMKTIITPLL